MAVVNNIPHTSYNVDEDPFDGVTLTVTCDDGYTFDGVPTINYNDNVFGDEKTNVSLTVNSDNNVATITSDEIDADTIIINGSVKGGSVPVAPTIVNNIAHTNYEVNGNDVTVTCEDGYIFDGTPTILLDGSSFEENMTVSSDNKIATYHNSDSLEDISFTLDGKTKESAPVPVSPTVVNNITGVTESHTVDGDKLTVNLSSSKVMVNVNCAYTNTDGVETNITVPVNVSVGVSSVASNGSITLTDADFTKNITITGDNKTALPVEWVLSGCSSDNKPNYAFLGESLNVVLTADDGNEFSDSSKNYIEPEGAFAGDKVLLTISEDKQQATGSYVPTTDEESLYIIGKASPKSSPVKKYGFINAYVVNETNLEDFATKRFVAYTGSGSTDADPINYDLGDYVNRVKRFFFEVEQGSTSKLNCGNFTVDTDVHNLATDVKLISFGVVDVPNYTESVADYSADVILFVPFVGVVSVDSEIIGQTVELTLSVNLLSGGGVYTLTCGDRIVWTQECKPCTDVIYRTSAQDVKTIGGTNFDSSYLMGLKPYLVIDRKQIVNNGVQATTDRFITIGDLTGYNKVTDIQFVNTAQMLQEDVDEIKQILRDGFTV